MFDKLCAAYAAGVSAAVGSIVVAGEVLPVWARVLIGLINGTGAAAGILANLSRKDRSDAQGK